MVEKLDDMETKLNEQIEKNISLNGRPAEATADGILDQVSRVLHRLRRRSCPLSESVEFESEAIVTNKPSKSRISPLRKRLPMLSPKPSLKV